MKKSICLLFLFVLLIISCNGKDVDMNSNNLNSNNLEGWKKVNNYVSEGRPKSALEEVEKIYKEAKKNGNSAEVLKCFIYRLKFIADIEENANAKTISSINEELKTAQFPEKNILHSMVAEIYWQYYQDNRYYINQRSVTENFENNDINTWDTKKIVEECINHYTLSLNDKEKLKKIDIKEYDLILNNGNYEKPYGRERRPTLFDFLGHRAFDYFANQQADVARPAETFIIDNPKFFSDTNDFVNLKIETKDNFAYKYYAMNILKDLIRLNQNNKIPFIDIELKRIKFIYDNYVGNDKDELYLKALKQLEKKEPNLPIIGEVSHQIAKYYYENGLKYSSERGDTNRWELKKAFDICDEVIKKFPNSIGSQNCLALQSKITEKTLGIVIEEVNLPNKPFKSLVKYKNFNKIYFSVYPVKKEDMDKIRQESDSYYNKNKTYKDYNAILIDYFKDKKAILQSENELPDDKDYQGHSVEVKLDGLALGTYIVFGSDKTNLNYDGGCVGYGFTTVSNISMIDRGQKDSTLEFYLLERELGLPIKDAKVDIYEEKYNNLISQYQYNKVTSIKTDTTGYFEIKPDIKDGRNLYIEISKGDDKFEFLSNNLSKKEYKFVNFYQYYKRTEPTGVKAKVFIFTDRSIYRPEQNIYFKAIAIRSNNKDSNEILVNENMNLIFYDPNWQKIGEQSLTTNKFGSVSGMFVAPKGTITGQMQIYAYTNTYGHCGTTIVSVEEYKRPKFEVTFQPIKDSYRLNDLVKVTGNAKAYSGANIDNAKVKYRVTRIPNFPYWFYYWYGYYPQSSPVEITNGEITTNQNGEFNIEFKAIPDMTLSKESGVTFTYQIAVDITDLNGETRSGVNTMQIGYQALNLGLYIWDKVDRYGKNSFDITSTNLAGEDVDSEGVVKIYKLKNPDNIYRDRLWAKPDKFIYTYEESRRYFPNDLYDDENNFYKWQKEREVYSKKYNTKNSKKLIIDNLKELEEGKYYLEISTKDKFGSDVNAFYYFTVYSTNSKYTAIPESYLFNEEKSKLEPGEVLNIEVASLSKHTLLEIERDGKIIEKRVLELNPKLNKGLLEKSTIQVAIKEEYRGNIGLHYTFVNYGRFYKTSRTITVPYTNKELDIAFETFRDKLLPGEEEEWRIKIAGKNKDKVMSEMVLSLYDGSLDAFKKHNYYFNIYNSYYAYLSWDSKRGFGSAGFTNYSPNWNTSYYDTSASYDYLNWFGYRFEDFTRMRLLTKSYKSMSRGKMSSKPTSVVNNGDDYLKMEESMPEDESKEKNIPSPLSVDEPDTNDVKKDGGFDDVQIRTNFNETAFFYPNLTTNKDGEVIVNFKIPDSLTKWKLIGLAHTEDLKYGFIQKELVTQKDLMVVPNPPRFFREGDSIIFSAKITNISDRELSGETILELFDATTMKSVNIFDGDVTLKKFTTKAGQSDLIKWKLKIPPKLNAITYRLVAKSGKFSDGEEMAIPVLTNRMLVTETLPLPIRSNQTKTYTFDKLINNNSPTLVNHKLTLEFTSNPAWSAVLALPYLIEYPYECSEQLFNRYYSNILAMHIINSSPKIKEVFETWKNLQPDAFLSNLEKNQELKSIIIEETPWLLDAKDETTRKRRIGILFEVNKMNGEIEKIMKKLEELQSSNGGFAWFKGMKENVYITQYIVTGIGHLAHLKVIDLDKEKKLNSMVKKAVSYIDNQMKIDYDWLLKAKIKDKLDLSQNQIGYYHINYFYARSFFKNIEVSSSNEEAFNYFRWQIKTYWNSYLYNKYFLGLIALGLYRYGEDIPKKFHSTFNKHKMKNYGSENIPEKIVTSLKESALYSDELGMYWKADWGFYWYQLPIETYALMIELFSEAAKDNDSVDGLKTYLLKQKQTSDWGTTKGTADAIYALLLQGDNWLASESLVEITLGNTKIEPPKDIEAGSGYFKISYNEDKITKDMGKVTLVKKDKGVSWGALYWQYFENLDKITKAETPLKLDKKLFIENNTPSGKVIVPIEKQKIKIGDKIIVRIELRVDRDMEYVHMKDQRASALEPVNVLSRYKYQDGLGYYESTRDTATNFFFDYLPKGTYVFEYPLFVTHNGDFSNGITTIQCMYAPEFSSHSEGIRFKVE